MNRQLLNTVKANRIIYNMLFKDISKAEAFTTEDNEFKIVSDGDLRYIKIYFRGNAIINSRLPEGYSIYVGKGMIRIRNIMGNPLPLDNVLFTYESGFFVRSAEARSWFRKTIRIKVNKYEITQLMSLSETNFEDDTLIFSEVSQTTLQGFIQRGGCNNNIITGLYTNVPFSNGYTGYYHYFQKEKLYMTGKYPNKASQLLGNTKIVNDNISSVRRLIKSRNIQNKKTRSDRRRGSFDKASQIVENEVSERKKTNLNPLNRARLNFQVPLKKEGLSQRVGEASKMIAKATIKKGGY